MSESEKWDFQYKEKLCQINEAEKDIDMETLKEQIKNWRFFCNGCGRVAEDEGRLCSPECFP